MANYATLKSAIEDNIKQNGTGAITGPVMQSALLVMINSLGAGYQFMGVATPSTNPGTPDYRCFYLASTPGTYNNLGGLVVNEGEVAILKWDESWSKEDTGTEFWQNIKDSKVALYGTPLEDLPMFDMYVGTSGVWGAGKHSFIPVKPGDSIYLRTTSSTMIFAFVKSLSIPAVSGESPDYCDGTSAIILGSGNPRSYTATAPSDAKYLLITRYVSTSARTSYISHIEVNGYNVVTGLYKNYKDLNDKIAGINERFDGTTIPELSYSGTPFAGNYINESGLSYPAGRLKIAVDGIGTAINTWRYSINGGDTQTTTDSEVFVDLPTGLTALRIWTAGSYIIDNTKTLSISVSYLGLEERVSDLENNVIGGMQLCDFNLKSIANKYATDAHSRLFEDSFSFDVSGGVVNENIIISCTAKYSTGDSSVPTIQFVVSDAIYTYYTSPQYTIGALQEESKEWRIPPVLAGQKLTVNVTIPEGVSVTMSEFSNRYSGVVNRATAGYRMNAHINIMNFNTLDAFVLEAKLGYPCAIVVPKRTSDGIWVCFHDDSNIGASLVDENHQALVEPEYSASISDITFTRLQQLWYKAQKGKYRKVATMDEFLTTCAKTGMHPMFSWHPVQSSTSQLQEVKELVNKYGLLPYLNIKMSFDGSSTSAMSRVYGVFGTDIESYAGDVNTNTDISEIITALESIGIDKTKVRVGLELFNARLTLEKVQAILSAGLFAAVAWMTADPTGEELAYWMQNGCSEFTEYNMISYGLNW